MKTTKVGLSIEKCLAFSKKVLEDGGSVLHQNMGPNYYVFGIPKSNDIEVSMNDVKSATVADIYNIFDNEDNNVEMLYNIINKGPRIIFNIGNNVGKIIVECHDSPTASLIDLMHLINNRF